LNKRDVELQEDGGNSRRFIICIKYLGDQIREVEMDAKLCTLGQKRVLMENPEGRRQLEETWTLMR
jgi:hypothetical protein